MTHHYLDDFRQPEPDVVEPVRLWAEQWITITSWRDVEIAPFKDGQSVLTWPRRPGFQYAVVSNIDLAGLLWS